MDTVPQAPLILITGGGRGVGAATARLAAAQGYDVAISFVSNEAAALAVAADVEAVGHRALAVRADNADPEQVAQLFAAIDREFGRIDVLVNNAALLMQQSRLEDLEFERMLRIFAVNSIGPILSAQARGLATTGRVADAVSLIDSALAHCERSGERWYLAELHRLRGEILGGAEADFRRALAIAGAQGELSWELRAATSLARCHPTAETRGLLAAVLGRFTEGFDLPDLQAAALLAHHTD